MSDATTTGKGETIGKMENELNVDNKSPQTKRPRYKNTIHLWEFLLELLADEQCSSMIAWSRKDYGEFKLKNQEEVAKKWGIVKHRAGMNYEKLSRAIRYYYHQGIIQKVPGQRLVYKFGKLPYEYKPRVKRPVRIEDENKPLPAPLDHVKQESQAFLPLTSLTPPPEIGYQFPSLLPRNFPPVYSCYVDYCFGTTCPFTNFTAPIIVPHSCGYACNTLNNTPPSPPRAIPVSVITSTYT